MTDYEAWEQDNREEYRKAYEEELIHRCPQCDSVMIRQKEPYNLTMPFQDQWWECTNVHCNYTEDL